MNRSNPLYPVVFSFVGYFAFELAFWNYTTLGWIKYQFLLNMESGLFLTMVYVLLRFFGFISPVIIGLCGLNIYKWGKFWATNNK